MPNKTDDEKPAPKRTRESAFVIPTSVLWIAALFALVFVVLDEPLWTAHRTIPRDHHARRILNNVTLAEVPFGLFYRVGPEPKVEAEAQVDLAYNVTLGNNPSAPANQVENGKPVDVKFSIGPDDARSILKTRRPSKKFFDFLKRRKSIIFPFEVTMSCAICRDSAPKMQTVYFDTRTNASSSVTWRIIPDAAKAAAESLHFDITYQGEMFDTRSAGLVFAGATKTQLAAAQSVGEDCPPPESTFAQGSPDIVIHYSVENGVASFVFDIVDEELRKSALGALTRRDSRAITFYTTLNRSDALLQMSQSAYDRLCAYLDPSSPGGQTNECPPEDGKFGRYDDPGSAHLDDAGRDQAARLLASIGSKMYGTLTANPSDLNLARVFEEIEKNGDKVAADHRVLRISIIMRGAEYIPWQLMYSPSTYAAQPRTPDVKQFWGHKFILSSDPLFQSCGRRPAVLNVQPENRFLLLRYRESGSGPVDDSVFSGYTAAVASAAKSAGIRASIQSDLQTKAQVDDFVAKSRNTISLVSVFSHGDSGLRVKIEDGEWHYRSPPEAASLLLSGKDRLYSDDLALWKARHSPAGSYAFPLRPIVFLNGCHTGTMGGYSRTDAATFQMTFLDLGARVVVVTEAPIPAAFGSDFGQRFMKRLFEGTDTARALWETRNDELLKNNNPFGLLYSLYGNDNVTMSRYAAKEN